MRKFYIRWWYTRDWAAMRMDDAQREMYENPLADFNLAIDQFVEKFLTQELLTDMRARLINRLRFIDDAQQEAEARMKAEAYLELMDQVAVK